MFRISFLAFSKKGYLGIHFMFLDLEIKQGELLNGYWILRVFMYILFYRSVSQYI